MANAVHLQARCCVRPELILAAQGDVCYSEWRTMMQPETARGNLSSREGQSPKSLASQICMPPVLPKNAHQSTW